MDLLFTPVGFLGVLVALGAGLALATRPLVALSALVVVSVLLEYATLNWPLLAGVCTMLTIVTITGILREKSRSRALGLPSRISTPADRYVWGLGLVGVIYLVVGIVRGNQITLSAGDFYHVMFELVIPFFLVTVFVKSREDLTEFVRYLCISGIVLGVVVLVLYFSGSIQDMAGGGSDYHRTEFWRLRPSHNFPMPPLLFVLPIWLLRERVFSGRLAGIATAVLFVALLLTLKRTYWLSTLAVSLMYLANIGVAARMRSAAIVGVALLIGLVGAVAFGGRSGLGTDDIAEYQQTISTRFSGRQSDMLSSVGNRQSELSSGLSIGLRNPFGHGLGSEFDVQRQAGGALVKRHYIHNVYVHYLLQAGIPYLVLFFLFSAKVLSVGFRLVRTLPDGFLKSVAMGSVGCYLAILVSAMTELAIHTFFVAFTAALVFVVDAIAKREQADGVTQSARGVIVR